MPFYNTTPLAEQESLWKATLLPEL
ncbi:uncharacterized protein METZ01_LOCUS146415, partial [marine metagenome]